MPPKFTQPLDSAIKIMRQNIGLWNYHVAKSNVIKSQADRISDIFELLDNATWMKDNIRPNPPYAPMGFKSQWNDFMKKRFQAVIDKHTAFLTEYYDKLNTYMNSNPVGLTAVQAKRITDIGNRIATKPVWVNPYP